VSDQYDPVAPIKYPLACGCAGPKYISKCCVHQDEDIVRQRRLLGIRDPGAIAREAELVGAVRAACKEMEGGAPSRAATDRLRAALEAWDAGVRKF
jgi:hypothetical protein